jgi:hypothetical protein
MDRKRTIVSAGRLKGRKLLLSALVAFAALFGPLLVSTSPAFAWKCSCCKCFCKWSCCSSGKTQNYITNAFTNYREDFIMGDLWTDTAEPDLQSMTSDLIAAIVGQTEIIGTFFDASIQIDTERDIHKLAAEATRDYTPSTQLCRFGSLSKSLAASDMKAKANQSVLSEIALARHLGTVSNAAAAGRGMDYQMRITQFAQNYCDFKDNDGGNSDSGLYYMCGVVASNLNPLRHNLDIDFTRVMDDRLTLDADFTNAAATSDETDMIELGKYLYGHRQFTVRSGKEELIGQGGGAKPATSLLLEMRGVNAARSVAQNSFLALAGLKAQGSPAAANYISGFAGLLGMPAADAARLLGANPSYYAQMDILTRKAYQDPGFYANLMDAPANVSRTTAAMEGLELMQDRDIYNAMTRSEMLIATLVELEARKVQDSIQGEMAKPHKQ